MGLIGSSCTTLPGRATLGSAAAADAPDANAASAATSAQGLTLVHFSA